MVTHGETESRMQIQSCALPFAALCGYSLCIELLPGPLITDRSGLECVGTCDIAILAWHRCSICLRLQIGRAHV